MFAAIQEFQLDQELCVEKTSTDFTDQRGCCSGSSTGGEQIVDQDYSFSRIIASICISISACPYLSEYFAISVL